MLYLEKADSITSMERMPLSVGYFVPAAASHGAKALESGTRWRATRIAEKSVSRAYELKDESPC